MKTIVHLAGSSYKLRPFIKPR